MPHVYQMSYPMLIMQRTSVTSIIVYLDVIVNPAEYHELWNDSGTRTERLENLFIKHDVSSMDESAFSEERLFVENSSVTYDVDSLVTSNVGHA